MIDIETLRKLLRYEPQTGKLYWRKRPLDGFKNPRQGSAWNTKHAGKEALIGQTILGYFRGTILGQPMLAHRAIWALCNGMWPDGEIDHINGIPCDNRLENLRVVDRTGNCRNLRRYRRNTTGVTGVVREKNSFRAVISVGGRQKCLGRHKTLEQAKAARALAEIKEGYHPNHGRDQPPVRVRMWLGEYGE